MYYRKSAASFTEAALLSCVRSKKQQPRTEMCGAADKER